MKLLLLFLYLLSVTAGLVFEWKRDGKPRAGVHNFKIALFVNVILIAIVIGAVFMN